MKIRRTIPNISFQKSKQFVAISNTRQYYIKAESFMAPIISMLIMRRTLVSIRISTQSSLPWYVCSQFDLSHFQVNI